MQVEYFSRFNKFYLFYDSFSDTCNVPVSDCWWLIPTWENYYQACEE